MRKESREMPWDRTSSPPPSAREAGEWQSILKRFSYTQKGCPTWIVRQPLIIFGGGMWGSNPRHSEPQSDALPTELRPPYNFRRREQKVLKFDHWIAASSESECKGTTFFLYMQIYFRKKVFFLLFYTRRALRVAGYSSNHHWNLRMWKVDWVSLRGLHSVKLLA